MKLTTVSHRTAISRAGGIIGAMGLLLAAVPAGALPFNSGSSCHQSPAPVSCLGAFTTSVNTVIDLPPDGILNYTTFNVPQGITVTFKKNAANTPVTILASSDVVIEGSIDLSGTSGTPSGTAGNGVLGDDGQPGLGGPGGFDGGMGGLSALFGGAIYQPGSAGKGPGGGHTTAANYGGNAMNGGGGGFGTAGANSWNNVTAGGPSYGQASLLPLVGGSGGGGGNAGNSFNGAGGGGAGGAILIASSGTITVGKAGVGGAGRIWAQGLPGADNGGTGCGGAGGGGSGGAIRLVAETVNHLYDGTLYAQGAAGGGGCYGNGGAGGAGIIRIEANTTNWSGYTNPAYNFAIPGKVFVPNSPTLTITKVGTATVPATPTGVGDITLPEATTNAAVEVAATNIPIGTTVTIHVIPASGATRSSVQTGALAGASDAATTATSVTDISLSPGNNVLLATATYTVTEIIAASLPRLNGEYVAKIRVESEMGGKSKVVYITASGKEYPADVAQQKKAAS